jgi:glutamyl-Q tRNA(Asp) synthetase
MNAPYIGRFAPSPTGPLHLGSLATALGSYLDARLHQGQWLVRIEDIDQGRSKPEFTEDILRSLTAHGLQPDETPKIQSQRHAIYQTALEQLQLRTLTYPCACNRKTLDAVNSGRAFGQNRIYPGTCRQGLQAGQSALAIRFRCPTHPIAWHDHRLGPMLENLMQTSGDFVLKRRDGFWAYHFVVVVDDASSEITHIVRGEDLASTTARQIALYEAFGQTPPQYWHLPVILAPDGQKLSKQTGAKAINPETPIDNLNQVWAHFGLPKQSAQQVSAWLSSALPLWANYRENL